MESNYGYGGGAAGGRGRGRGRGGGGRANYQNQGGNGRGYNQSQSSHGGNGRGYHQNQWSQGGNVRGYNESQGSYYQSQSSQGGGRGWDAPQRGYQPRSPAQQQWVRPPVQESHPPVQQAWGNRPLSMQLTQQPRQHGVAPTGGRTGSWTGRPWGPSTSSHAPVQAVPSPKPPSQQSTGELGLQKPNISEEKASSSSGSKEGGVRIAERPDKGGKVAVRPIRLLVNHFPVSFNQDNTIFHYDVEVKPSSKDDKVAKRSLKRPDMRVIRDRVFSEHKFPIRVSAYDGEKNIFSAVHLPTGDYMVESTEADEVRSGSYTFSIKLVNELKLSKLNDYLRGNLPYIPRDILQGMDLVMKENPTQRRIMVGKSFYSKEDGREIDIYGGLAAYKGFQHTLKPTSRGLALCLDFSVIAFRKPLPVIDYLKQHVRGFNVDNMNALKEKQRVINVLRGLKVKVTHRRTNQKFTIAGLSKHNARDSSFELVDPEGKTPPRQIGLVEYFMKKWGRDITLKNIPSLELGRGGKSNEVPMEFCVLVEGQRYPKEDLMRESARLLKDLSLAKPLDRRNTINYMVGSADGPCGDVMKNFEIGVDGNMTKVVGRVIGAPNLITGANFRVEVDDVKRQWNLVGKSFIDAKRLDRWVLLDFTEDDRSPLNADAFVNKLMGRCRNLGIQMERPLFRHATRMRELSSVTGLEKLLKFVVEKSSKSSKDKLQMIVCVMTRRDPGYKNLKWVSETKIGVVTQCCLAYPANKADDQYLANLCLKINAKLGGSNFELGRNLPHFGGEDHVMFIGADVNHPGPNNKSCPSIAAVVGTVNWPAANRYAARVRPQESGCEQIINFGDMCVELIKNYARLNKDRPKRIVIFRDGVSDGQLKMVLTEEFLDLKKALGSYDNSYGPTVTVVVARKRHLTRLFVDGASDQSGNVPSGTVVDTEIIHPVDFDFYLCSHYGALGTSKPTHYYVIWDENEFSSDELQQLIYDMCFTFARCTKPVSLVPPVFYADLVAYRGRMFQEAAMESQYNSPTASFDQSFYNLHSELKDYMFFV